MNSNVGTTQSLYTTYEDSALLSKLEMYAIWTIASIFPKDNHRNNSQGNAIIEHDYQSKGSELVNSLASKLTQSLFPVGQSFFRINPTDQVQGEITKGGYDNLIALESEANRRLMLNASYAQLTLAIKLLIITGNALLVRRDDKVSVYSLRNYVTKRNAFGEVQDIILREKVNKKDLSPSIKRALGKSGVSVSNQTDDTYYILYTRVALVITNNSKGNSKHWQVTQEINGVDVGTNEVYPYDLNPYIPAVWSIVNGDDYGRGYIEDYTGDFAKLSDVSQAMGEYTLEALKILNLVDPSDGTDIDSLANAVSGDYVLGKATSVTPYEGGSSTKLQAVSQDLQLVEQRLERAFMYTGNSRDGERVTAYEIQANAQQAEAVLGGVYSQLSQTLHLPLAHLLLHEVVPQVIDEVIRGTLKLDIITGLQALSRSASNQALVLAAQQIATVVQVFRQLGKQYDTNAIAEQILLSNGIDTKSILKSPEQLKQEQAQEQQANQQAQAQQIAQGTQLQQQQAINSAQGLPTQ